MEIEKIRDKAPIIAYTALLIVTSMALIILILTDVATEIPNEEINKCRTESLKIEQINITSHDCTFINIYVPKEQQPYGVSYNDKFKDITLKDCDLFIFHENTKNNDVYIEYEYNKTRTIPKLIGVVGEPICEIKLFKLLKLLMII